MASKICLCNGKPANTGASLCDLFPGVPYLPILVRRYADDGTRNYVDTTVDLDSAYFTALINHADASKRWYPLVPMKNVEDKRDDNVVEQFNDGSAGFVREGTRKFSAILRKVGPIYKGKLDEFRCADYDMFIVDLQGSLNGIIQAGDSTKLYGAPIDRGTWAPVWMPMSDNTEFKIMLTFQFEQSMDDSDIRLIALTNNVATGISGIDLRTVVGLYDVHIEWLTHGTTSSSFRLYTDFGGVMTPVPVKDMTISQFFESDLSTGSSLWNVTDSAGVAISALTESATDPGTYTATYSTLTGKVLRAYPKRNGFDFSEVYDGSHDNVATA